MEQQIKAAYCVMKSTLSNEDISVLSRFEGETDIELQTCLVSQDIFLRDLNAFDLIWIHSADSRSFDNWKEKSEKLDWLKPYYEQGGRLLFTNYAAFLPFELGIESNRPEARAVEINEDSQRRKYGFHCFRSHPLFDKFNGGVYIWQPYDATTTWRIGYFENHLPLQGKVVAIEKAYITLFEEHRLVIEYTQSPGKIVSIGGFFHFGTENNLSLHLTKFAKNVFRYLARPHNGSVFFWWVRDENKPKPFTVDPAPLPSPLQRSLSDRKQAGLLFTREKASENFCSVSGERCLIMGRESGGIDEVWVHPFRVLRHLEIGIVFDNKVTWCTELQARLEIRPESIIRHYSTRFGILTETVFASRKRPGGIVHLKAAFAAPVPVIIRFMADLRIMWPYSEQALGSIYYGYGEKHNALHIKDHSGDFYCLVGCDLTPAAHLTGPYKTIEYDSGTFRGIPADTNQVYHAALYELNAENDYTLNCAIAATNQGYTEAEECFKYLLSQPLDIYNKTVEHYRHLLRDKTVVVSPDKDFNEGYQWALVGIDRFFATTPGVGSGLLAGYGTSGSGWDGGQKISGRPGYAWYFGRDALWAALAVNSYGDFSIVKSQLKLFEKYQDVDGKIFHELTTSGSIHYDAADATPLYVILAAQYLKSSGDLEFIAYIWHSIQKSMDFLYDTDSDGDGLIENTNVGHGWVEGGPLYGVHTTLYLAGLWAQALRDASYLAEKLNKNDLQKKYKLDAEKVIGTINRDFWNERTRFYRYGKHADGQYNNEKTIFPAVLAYFNLLEPGNVKHVLEEYAGNTFSTDWGVRIVSSDSPVYDPSGYHCGSVWPLYTGWSALAEYKYGRAVQGFAHIMNNLHIRKQWALGFIEEVLHGEQFQPAGVCPHQCWSESSVVLPVLAGMLGFDPDAPEETVGLSPRFPLHWNSAQVKNLWVGASCMDMQMKRNAALITYTFKLSRGPALTVHLSPEIPEGARIAGIKVNNVARPAGTKKRQEPSKKPVVFPLKDTAVVEIQHTAGIGILPVVPIPEPGHVSLGHRIMKTALVDKTYRITVEGRQKTTCVLGLKLFDTAITHIEGAELADQSPDATVGVIVNFGAAGAEFERKTITLYVQ